MKEKLAKTPVENGAPSLLKSCRKGICVEGIPYTSMGSKQHNTYILGTAEIGVSMASQQFGAPPHGYKIRGQHGYNPHPPTILQDVICLCARGANFGPGKLSKKGRDDRLHS